ncbi:MAG: aminoacyl-tRNA hydrolase [Kyrpidia sp.]|nr:aminoacyl-tRNA hydrolase [Kyrpidia sp.]
MWLIAGLGNPGPAYARTRHNAGFMVVECLARRWGVSLSNRLFHSLVGVGRLNGETAVLLEPQTFMNESGRAVREALDGYGLDAARLIVVYDDLDLPLGKVRLRAKGSSGGHNGVKSILLHLGVETFGRVRIGIGRPAAGRDVISHVLSPFSPDEAAEIEAAVERAADLIEIAVRQGFQTAVSKA